MPALTLGAVLTIVANIFLSTIYYINELFRRIGALPLMIFLAGVLLWDMTTINPLSGGYGYIGWLLSLGTNFFFGIQISSLTLFIFMVGSIMVWFWAKTHDIIK